MKSVVHAGSALKQEMQRATQRRAVWDDVWPLACRMDHISVMERPMPAEDDAAAAAGMTMSGVDGRGGVGGAAAVVLACSSSQ